MNGWVVERIARNILNSAPKIIPMKMSTDGHHQDTRASCSDLDDDDVLAVGWESYIYGIYI